MIIEINDDDQLVCIWFASCRNPADGVIQHPILGQVPACHRCGEIAGEPIKFALFSFDRATETLTIIDPEA